MADVAQYMSRSLHSVSCDATLQEAGEEMRKFKVSSLLVVKGGECVGIITDTDMARKAIAKGGDAATRRVESIMTAPLTFIDAHSDVEEANRIMREKEVRHLVVTDEGKVAGVISLRDIVQYFAQFFRTAE